MKLSEFFKLLSDESKLKIIKHLMLGEECVCQIAEKLGLEQSLVSHHLSKLREAGLIKDRKVGSWIHCSINQKTWEKMEKKFALEIGSLNIKNKPCRSHKICCQIPIKNK
jgi:DNA-binding transcriptional ArsR family regulator